MCPKETGLQVLPAPEGNLGGVRQQLPVTLPEDEEQLPEVQPLLWGGRTLRSHFQHKVAKAVEVDNVPARVVLQRVEAAAEAMMTHQHDAMKTVLAHVKTMLALQQWKGLALGIEATILQTAKLPKSMS